MSISDTSPEAEEVQLEIYRRMSAQQRLLLALEISEFTRCFARAGIRADHPDWNRDQIERELLRRSFFPNPLPAGF